jgi:NodT family efflux transporter outer membrane factor (OMF) lipoprotein
LPGATGAVAIAPVPDDWWHLYNDPVLNGLVLDALHSSTDLRVAAARLARAQALVDVARAQGGWSGSASAMVRRAQEAGEQYLLFEKVPVSNEAAFDLDLSYEFDLFGKLRRGIEAASADADAAQAALDLARVTLVAAVVRAYVQNCAVGNELQVAQQALALQQQLAQATRQLRAAGRAVPTDIARANAQVQLVSATLPPLRARRQLAQYELAMLLARAPGALPAAVLTCAAAPRLTQPLPVGDAAALLKRRPDVREAERQLAAATARIGVATAALYPDVSFGISAGTIGLASDIDSPDTNHWAFGPLLNWTFPTNGARERVRAAGADADAALAHFDGVVLNALRETESQLATYANDLERAAALASASHNARQAADDTSRLYGAGRVSLLADLDANRTRLSADAQLAAADSQIALDQVNLFAALGGGWRTAAQQH